MVKLTPEEQGVLLRDIRELEPSAGAGGRQGFTNVTLAVASRPRSAPR